MLTVPWHCAGIVPYSAGDPTARRVGHHDGEARLHLSLTGGDNSPRARGAPSCGVWDVYARHPATTAKRLSLLATLANRVLSKTRRRSSRRRQIGAAYRPSTKHSNERARLDQ